ncbi:MAG: hypothetical protein MJZ34_05130 [Paludibacteraceae bacterium]|nr:hypothetical protein [Paludibacteraceae bacterium]
MPVSRYNLSYFLDTNVVDGQKEFDFSSLPQIESISDQIYIVKDSDYARPDVISWNVYGNCEYWWILMEFNGISDIWHDLIPGTILKCPYTTEIEAFVDKYCHWSKN